MTYQEIGELVARVADAAGCGYHYYDEVEREVFKAPYLLFDYPDRDDFYADDINYAKIQRVNIEYASKKKEIETEKKIEAVLDSYELSHSKEDGRLEGHDIYEVMYSMEIVVTEE